MGINQNSQLTKNRSDILLFKKLKKKYKQMEFNPEVKKIQKQQKPRKKKECKERMREECIT